jgi:ABC-2 type transport system ATP-binding protein
VNYSIETNGLTKKFGRFTAVDHIDVAVAPGEVFGFLGANGAGKTTAIRMLCGLLQPSSGHGHVAGFDIVRESARIRSRIGYMSQKFSLYNDLTVRQNLEVYAGLYGVAAAQVGARIAELATRLSFSDLLPRRTGDIPWGWQQRLSLAAANLHRPGILFLDEPTGSVDPLSRRSFWDLIHALAKDGTTIFVTTHYMDEAEYCQRISLMVDGRVAAVGSPRELKRAEGVDSLQEVFLRIVEKGRPK